MGYSLLQRLSVACQPRFQLGEHPCALLNARAFGKLKFAGEFFIGRAVPDQRNHEVVSSLACRASRALLALRM